MFFTFQNAKFIAKGSKKLYKLGYYYDFSCNIQLLLFYVMISASQPEYFYMNVNPLYVHLNKPAQEHLN